MRPATIYSKLTNRLKRIASVRLARRTVVLKGKRPIISFTFDDFPVSALIAGGTILESHGLKGTFYASIGLMNSRAPTGRIFDKQHLLELLGRGHELGCHTFAHCHAWKTPATEFRYSIIANSEALAEIAPGAKFRSLSYPISGPRPDTKRVASAYFPCCRGGGQVINQGTTDLNYLKSFFLEQSHGDIADVQRSIDTNSTANGWLIFSTHDVEEQPTRFGVRPRFFEEVVLRAIRSGAQILPVATALDLLFSNR